jgi:hypothetical protein
MKLLLLTLVILCGCSTEAYQSTTVAGQSKIASQKIEGCLNQVKIGQTESDVIASIGRPLKINTTITASGKQEQWIYDTPTLANNLLSYMYRSSFMFEVNTGQVSSRSYYFYFENGVLTSMQEQQ